MLESALRRGTLCNPTYLTKIGHKRVPLRQVDANVVPTPLIDVPRHEFCLPTFVSIPSATIGVKRSRPRSHFDRILSSPVSIKARHIDAYSDDDSRLSRPFSEESLLSEDHWSVSGGDEDEDELGDDQDQDPEDGDGDSGSAGGLDLHDEDGLLDASQPEDDGCSGDDASEPNPLALLAEASDTAAVAAMPLPAGALSPDVIVSHTAAPTSPCTAYRHAMGGDRIRDDNDDKDDGSLLGEGEEEWSRDELVSVHGTTLCDQFSDSRPPTEVLHFLVDESSSSSHQTTTTTATTATRFS